MVNPPAGIDHRAGSPALVDQRLRCFDGLSIRIFCQVWSAHDQWARMTRAAGNFMVTAVPSRMALSISRDPPCISARDLGFY